MQPRGVVHKPIWRSRHQSVHTIQTGIPKTSTLLWAATRVTFWSFPAAVAGVITLLVHERRLIMTKGDAIRMTGLFSVMLMCLGIAWASGNATTIRTSVPDGVADGLRAGACNNLFTTDNAHPIYCGGNFVGCNGNQMPNTVQTGTGNSGSQAANCGTGQRCTQTYTQAADCAG